VICITKLLENCDSIPHVLYKEGYNDYIEGITTVNIFK